jgi:hypothetical protein
MKSGKGKEAEVMFRGVFRVLTHNYASASTCWRRAKDS